MPDRAPFDTKHQKAYSLKLPILKNGERYEDLRLCVAAMQNLTDSCFSVHIFAVQPTNKAGPTGTMETL